MMAEMSTSSSPTSLTPDGVTKTCSNQVSTSPQANLLVGAIGPDKDFGLMRNRIEDPDEDTSSFINNNNNNNIQPSHHHNNNNSLSGRPSSKSPTIPGVSSPSSVHGGLHSFPGSQDISKESEEFEDGVEEGDEMANRRSVASLPYHQESMKGKGESIPMEDEDMMRVEGDEGSSSNGPRQGVVKNEVMAVDEEYSQESENEMPVEYEDDEEDSEKEEHRITVREALMSRAFHQQQQATKYSGGKHSFSGGGSRLISPSISPPSHHNHGNQDSSNPASFIKSPLNIVNGHGGIQRHGNNSFSRHHQNNRSSFTSYHQQQSVSASRHHSSSRYHHQQHLHSRHSGSQIQHQLPDQQNTEAFLKSDRKSSAVPLSPNQTDLKPDSMGASDPSGSLNGIGNALLSLASLGSLAALQQSIPNFMASVAGHTGQGGGGQHPHNTPLNLTNPTSAPNNSSSPQSPFHHHSSVFHSKSHPLMQHLPHQPMTSPQGHSRTSTLSPNSLVANAIANLAGNGGAGSLANIGQPGSSIPQLILASGQISQGIQGAQLLIPTSQGIMSQTVLTIPITQPGSPIQNVLSPTLQQGAGGSGNGSRGGSSHHQSSMDSLSSLKMSNNGGTRDKNLLLHTNNSSSQRNHHDQLSPPGVSRIPRSPASPELPGGQLSSPLMGLGSHLVSSQIGSHMSTIHEKLVMEHNNGGVNGVRNPHGKRERESGGSSGTPGGLLHHHHHSSSLLAQQPKSSPCSIEGSMNDNESDRFSDNDDDQMVEGINLDEIKEFAKAFKLRRLSLGLTQTQVGQALSVTEGPAYSQSAICSALAWQLAQSQSQTYPSSSIHQQSMFEKLDITPKSAQKIKPVLERWMKEAEERYKNGHQNLNDFVGMEPSKKRKRRTSFTPQALELLNNHFERNTHPSGAEITTLAHQLGYEREVIRIWFCNKRQALKNTVRMMSKGSSPM